MSLLSLLLAGDEAADADDDAAGTAVTAGSRRPDGEEGDDESKEERLERRAEEAEEWGRGGAWPEGGERIDVGDRGCGRRGVAGSAGAVLEAEKGECEGGRRARAVVAPPLPPAPAPLPMPPSPRPLV